MKKFLHKINKHENYIKNVNEEHLYNITLCKDEYHLHYDKYVAPFFCKLTLNDNSIVKLEGNGALTSTMISDYKSTLTNAEIGTQCTSIGFGAFDGCNNLTSIVIPNNVTSIGGYAFQNCSSLTSIIIPNNVTSIGDNTFYKCNGLTTCTIGNGVTSIGKNAFRDCSGLTNVTIGNSVTSILSNAFTGCSRLTTITIPSTVTKLDNWCFQNCTALESVNFVSNNTLTIMGISAFENCSNLTSIIIPSSVTSILDSVFVNTRAMACHVTFPSVASIPPKCFTNSGITGITIPSTVTTIANQALNACKLVNLVIPDSVTSINWYACAQITTLLTLEIGTGCTSIAMYAFNGCNHLTSITIKATTPPTLGSNAFNSTNSCPIYVPSDSVDAYKAAEGWSTYADRIQAIQ